MTAEFVPGLPVFENSSAPSRLAPIPPSWTPHSGLGKSLPWLKEPESVVLRSNDPLQLSAHHKNESITEVTRLTGRAIG